MEEGAKLPEKPKVLSQDRIHNIYIVTSINIRGELLFHISLYSFGTPCMSFLEFLSTQVPPRLNFEQMDPHTADVESELQHTMLKVDWEIDRKRLGSE